jgi:hypothetical protein
MLLKIGKQDKQCRHNVTLRRVRAAVVAEEKQRVLHYLWPGKRLSYGLDGPEIESRWGRDFSHTSRPALGPTQPPVQWVPGLSRG